ncbi:MAG: hypothetical protein FWD55_07830 [Propionibacteriaceae bacterium]|nr:hypothetical protein [Propionibacteriaceae bacterium]
MDKPKVRKIVSQVLYALAAVCLLIFVILACMDWFTYSNNPAYSAPFWAFLIVRGAVWLPPAVLMGFIGFVLSKPKKTPGDSSVGGLF